MRLIGKEHLLEPLNRNALVIAKKVAAEGDALVAGNISNTNIYNPKDEKSWVTVRAMFDEQVSSKSLESQRVYCGVTATSSGVV